MRVDFDDELFDIQRRPVDVIGLIALCERMGHTIGSRPATVTTWVQRLSKEVGTSIEQLLAKHRARLGSLGPAYRLVVGLTPSDWANSRLELEHAWRFLRSPLEVLLENERGDWAFIRTPTLHVGTGVG